MNEYYEMGVEAALEELEKCAAEGDEVAEKIAAKVLQFLKKAPGAIYGKGKAGVSAAAKPGERYKKVKEIWKGDTGRLKKVLGTGKQLSPEALAAGGLGAGGVAGYKKLRKKD